MAFTQRRSLTLPTLISLILTMDEKSMWKGLLGYFQNGIDTPSASAFIQQRKKLLRFISGGLSLAVYLCWKTSEMLFRECIAALIWRAQKNFFAFTIDISVG